MLFAVVGDIMGEAARLSVLLDSIAEQGIEIILHTGNMVLGPRPNEVIDLLRQHRVICVQGELDRLVVNYRRKQKQLSRFYNAAIITEAATAYDTLRSANLEFIAALPRVRELETDGLHIVLCHGLPGKANERLTSATPFQRLQRERENNEADAIICGGGDSAYWVEVDGTWFVNPGKCTDVSFFAQCLLLDTDVLPWQIKAAS